MEKACILCNSIYMNSTKCTLVSSDRKQISGYLGMEEREEQKGEVSKGREGSLWGDGQTHHLGCSYGFTDVYICQNLPNSTMCSLGNVN